MWLRGRAFGSHPKGPWFKSKHEHKMFKIVAKNTIYQIISKVFTAGGALVGTILITRFFGAKTFGDYSIVMAYVLSFYLISDLGINAITVKEFSQDEKLIKRNFSSILLLRIVIGILLVILCNLVLFLVPYQIYIKQAIRIGSLLIFFQAIYTTCNIVFQAKLNYKRVAVISFIGSTLSVLILIPVVLLGSSLHLLILAVAAGYLLYPIFSLFNLRRYINLSRESINYRYWFMVIALSLPIGISLILNSFMVSADRLILSFMVDSISVGLYSLAYKIFELVLVVPTFFMNAMYPLMVRYNGNSPKDFNKSVKTSIKTLTLVALMLTAVTLITSKFLITTIWGIEMQKAFVPFNILMAGSIFFFLSSPLSWVLVVKNKQRVLPVIYGLALIFNVILNIIFIPRYNYLASAVVTVLTEFLVLSALFIFVRRLPQSQS